MMISLAAVTNKARSSIARSRRSLVSWLSNSMRASKTQIKFAQAFFCGELYRRAGKPSSARVSREIDLVSFCPIRFA
jgi:hypothetical protein